MLDYLCGPCRAHFDAVRGYLDAMGLAYAVDPYVVRGLDYYTRTAWEAFAQTPSAQNAVFGGGRYDGLAEQLGGRPTPGVGFGMGLERLLLVLEQQRIEIPHQPGVDVYVATAGTDPAGALVLADRLRKIGIAADLDVMARGLRAQMRQADRLGARFVVVLGEDEVRRGVAAIREMATGGQEEAVLDAVPETLAALLRSQAAGKARG